MNENELIPRLITEFHYPPQGAKIIAEKLVNSMPEIQKAFLNFWEKGEVPLLEVDGYTISNLETEHGMKLLAALLTLDWLIREPDKAKASLRKGHDFVGKKNPS
jgi:hypothetical protein